MDHYRLFSAASGGCRSGEYIGTLLEAAHPPIPITSADLFGDVETRGTKMFFSQRRLKTDFNVWAVIHHLLSCPCIPCRKHRKDEDGQNPAAAGSFIDKLRAKNAWLLLPMMIYLGKLHYIYPWLDSRIDPDAVMRNDPFPLSSIGEFNSLFSDPLEARLFQGAYDRAWRMFHPVVFDVPPSGPFQLVRYSQHHRFPFLAEKKPEAQSQFGTIVRFEIPAEYVSEPVQRAMGKYQDAVQVNGDSRKYSFVRKVLRSTSLEAGMEDEVLGMVSTLNSDNIITLLAMYTWGTNIHYVFPYVKRNLDQVLRRVYPYDGSSDKPGDLLTEWLWTQMVGVAGALKAIHTEIKNPFPRSKGRVIAFHFDLKPENILVTHDKKLKITDFGQSVIQFVENGEQLATSFTLGDPKYMAPESWSGVVPESVTEAKDIMVLLNYDVWSLACIMLEVLMFLLEQSPSAIGAFDEERDAEAPKVTFFNRKNRAVKDCVQAKISTLRASSAEDTSISKPAKNYRASIFELLVDMFCFDKNKRLYSEQVLDRLNAAAKMYNKDSLAGGELLRDHIRKKVIDARPGYREIGWWDSASDRLRSFLDIDAVTVEQTARSPNGASRSAEICQIQLLYKCASVRTNAFEEARFVLKWAPKQSRSNDNPTQGCIIYTSETHLVPFYIDPTYSPGRHDCTLFGRFEGSTGFNPNVLLTLGFESRQHAQGFQEALLHCEISPSSSVITTKETSWTPFSTKSLWQMGTSKEKKTITTRGGSLIQFWRKRPPSYYPPPAGAGTRSVRDDNIAPVSPELMLTPFDSASTTVPDVAMAVFEGDRLLILPLNKRDKIFSSPSTSRVTAIPNRQYRHKYFRAAVTASTSPWDQGAETSNRGLLTVPMVALQENQTGFGGRWEEDSSNEEREPRMSSLDIRVARDEDVKKIESAVGQEWSR